MSIVVDINVLLAQRGMSVGDFADAIGLTPPNVAVLKNGRAKAVRFSTLDAICRTLDCQPGDVLRWVPSQPEEPIIEGRGETDEAKHHKRGDCSRSGCRNLDGVQQPRRPEHHQ